MMMETPAAWMRRITATASSISAGLSPASASSSSSTFGLGGDRPGHLQQLPLVQVERRRAGVGQVVQADESQVPCRPRRGPRPASAAVRPNMTAIATLSRTRHRRERPGIW